MLAASGIMSDSERIDPIVIRSVQEVLASTTRNSIQNCLRIEYLPENSRNLHTGISSELLVLQQGKFSTCYQVPEVGISTIT